MTRASLQENEVVASSPDGIITFSKIIMIAIIVITIMIIIIAIFFVAILIMSFIIMKTSPASAWMCNHYQNRRHCDVHNPNHHFEFHPDENDT